MSLQKKIVLSFLMSAFIIALLSVFLYLNFVEIKKETTFLELTDTIRSKSLQIRRHEKNYFLYAPTKATDESKAIHEYLGEMDRILDGVQTNKTGWTLSLKNLIREYRGQFSRIELLVKNISGESSQLKNKFSSYQEVSGLIESNFLDKPLDDVNYLQKNFSLKSDHRLIIWLNELDTEINSLRKTGENILMVSKELDKKARENVDNFIRLSRIGILIFFLLFVAVGVGTILFITRNVVRRLQLLTNVVEKTGAGNFLKMPVPARKWASHDEVETLIEKFNTMEEQLVQREKELIQSKKLAAIGTLASGVAHELNNPLNNIYTTAQRLLKKSEGERPVFIKKGLDDIFGQTMRVKSIVSDLLEFARGREPNFRPIELRSLVNGVYKHIGLSRTVDSIRFHLEFHPEEIVIYADQEQMERVFINLISNAIDAVSEEGDITVRAVEDDAKVTIRVSDTGRGILREAAEKIFEPFYTTKDKGTGLGLAVVFNIIQKHNGEITVESAEGRGATFIITLPRSAGSV